jgi:hypothetical protein
MTDTAARDTIGGLSRAVDEGNREAFNAFLLVTTCSNCLADQNQMRNGRP